MRKGAFVLALVGIVALTSFAAHIEVWEFGMANEFANLIQQLTDNEFTAQTGITVDIVANPSEGMQNKVLLAMVSGEPPDIVCGAADHIVEYGIRGAIVPLRKVFPEKLAEIESKLYSGTAMDHNGQGFGVVEVVGGVIGYQRTDILAELGMEYPQTWEELYQIWPRLKAQGHEVAFGLGGPGGNPQWGAYTFMRQHGGGFVDTATYRSQLNDPGTIAGFKEYIELYTVYKMPQEISYFTMFKSGELAICFESVTAYSAIDNGAPELNGRWSYALVPGTPKPDGTIDHQGFMGAQGMAISKDSKNKEEALKFIEWYLSDDIQSRLMVELPKRMPGAMWVTGNQKATLAIPIRPADREILSQQLNAGSPFAYYPGAMSINRYVNFAVQEVLQLGKTPEEALLNAHNITEQELRTKLNEYERFIKNLL